MKTYNFEYKFDGKYRKYKTSAKYRTPIKNSIDNKHYIQQQVEFLRELYPKGLNKQIKVI